MREDDPELLARLDAYPFASASVLADSASPGGVRLVTLELEYPRFVHSELLTHRMAARNSSSSRAIPTAKLVERVRGNPVRPVSWGANQKGMQAGRELSRDGAERADLVWRQAAHLAANRAEDLLALGLHKQHANRVLEPFLPIRTVFTATEWEGFFALRDHPDAQPEIRALARAMRRAIAASAPVPRGPGQWHLPYVSDAERAFEDPGLLPRVSAARCARVSYRLHDGRPTSPDEDLALFSRLADADPPHLSPLEHQAAPMALEDRRFCGPLRGWQRFRALRERGAL